MLERIKKYVIENVNNEEFANYLLRPINEGKHYLIGGISELIDYTLELSDEDIENLICEKLIELPDDVFTLEYYMDIDATGADKKDVKDIMMVLVQKISPNMILIMEFVISDDVIMNPIIALIPLGQNNFNYRDKNFPEIFMRHLQFDGVNENFIGVLYESPIMTTMGDISYFSLDFDIDGEDEEGINDTIQDLWNSGVSLVYRFATLRKQGTEVKVTPNTKIETTGRLKIRDISKDCYIIKLPYEDNYLGYSRKEPM